RRDLLELGMQVLRDVRNALEVDRFDHPFLVVANGPQAVGLEQVVLRGARELELGEGLGVAAHRDVVDAYARAVEEGLQPLRLDVTTPGQPVDGAGGGGRRGPGAERRGADAGTGDGGLPEEIAAISEGGHAFLLG